MGGPSSASVRHRQAERRISMTQRRGLVLLMAAPAYRDEPTGGWISNGQFIFPVTMHSLVRAGFAFQDDAGKVTKISTAGIAEHLSRSTASIPAAASPDQFQLVRGGM